MPADAHNSPSPPPALPPVIDVTTDREGLALAIRELLQQSFDDRDDRSRRLAADPGTANSAQIMASLRNPLTLSPGYYDRIHYLLQLESMTGVGIRFSLDDLTMAEITGLQLLKEERHKFGVDHPTCPQCGVANHKFAFRCRSCGVEFRHQHSKESARGVQRTNSR